MFIDAFFTTNINNAWVVGKQRDCSIFFCTLLMLSRGQKKDSYIFSSAMIKHSRWPYYCWWHRYYKTSKEEWNNIISWEMSSSKEGNFYLMVSAGPARNKKFVKSWPRGLSGWMCGGYMRPRVKWYH